MIAINTEFEKNRKNASIAISKRLFVSGWLLNKILHEVKNGYISANVEIHYEDAIPVGVALEITEPHYNDYKTMIFVKKSFRNKGIGSKLIKKLNPSIHTLVGKGIGESLNFWLKNGYKNIA